MALVTCTECKGQLSDTAYTCPHCGAIGPAQIAAQIFQREWADCQQKAIGAGALKPQGFGERFAANLAAQQGGIPFENTVLAQSRLDEWTRDCMRRKGYSV